MNDSNSLQNRTFLLFEQGKYQECCSLIRKIPPHICPTPVRILEAVCLYNLEEFQEAEICLRDLKARVPSSVDISLYLAKILEKRLDESARSEYAEAVRLAPDHPEAIRGYIRYLMNAGDNAAAFPLLKKLVTLDTCPDDLSAFMNCCLALDRAQEGMLAYIRAGSPISCVKSYVSLLSSVRQYDEIIRIYRGNSSARTDPEIRLLYAEALAGTSPVMAEQEFISLIETVDGDHPIERYISFLSFQGRLSEACELWSSHLSKSTCPEFRAMGVSLFQSAGNCPHALSLAEEMLFHEKSADYPDIRSVFSLYQDLLKQAYDLHGACDHMLSLLSSEHHPALITDVGRICEGLGRHEDARRQYFTAFKSDLVKSGFEYVLYLGRRGETREQTKTLMYILKTVKNTRDIEFIGKKILDLSLCDDEVIAFMLYRLSERITSLSMDGKEIYARILSIASDSALSSGHPDEGLDFALSGLSIVPADSVQVANTLFALLIACKDQTLPDHLPEYLHQRNQENHIIKVPLSSPSFSWLSPEEEMIIFYLQKHRVCNELDLRKISGTHRIAGLMNRIMRRAEEHGVHLIEKDGYSEFGEVYRYVGP